MWKRAPSGRVMIDYTNWRGERATREITPHSMRFGSSEWHPEKQWLLRAFDVAKSEYREFAMTGIHSWTNK